jgi:hypothetical protein
MRRRMARMNGEASVSDSTNGEVSAEPGGSIASDRDAVSRHEKTNQFISLGRLPRSRIYVPHPFALPYEMATAIRYGVPAKRVERVEFTDTTKILPDMFGQLWPAIQGAVHTTSSIAGLLGFLRNHGQFNDWLKRRVVTRHVCAQDGSNFSWHVPPLSDVFRTRFLERHGSVFETTRELDAHLWREAGTFHSLLRDLCMPCDTLYLRFGEGRSGIRLGAPREYIDGTYVFAGIRNDERLLCFAFTSRTESAEDFSWADAGLIEFSLDNPDPAQVVSLSLWEYEDQKMGCDMAQHLMPALLHALKVLVYLDKNEAVRLPKLERSDAVARLRLRHSRIGVRHARKLMGKYDRVVILPPPAICEPAQAPQTSGCALP